MKKILNLLLIFSVLLMVSCQTRQTVSIEEKAAAIHQKVFTLDSHCDTPMNLSDSSFDIGKENDVKTTRTRVDFPRMKKGNLDASFFAVFIGQGKRDAEGNKRAADSAQLIFDNIRNAVDTYSDLAAVALTPEDGYTLEKEGKRAIYIGIENGYPIGNILSNVEKYYNLGARYITLCHTKNNDICDSSTDKNGSEWNGLSPFGEEVVREMNRLGMIIDISHASDETFYDVIELSKAPIIASHSCARAISDHPRNLTDDMLKKLAENGGVIQLCILGEYVKRSPENPEKEKAIQALMEKYSNYESLNPEDKQKAREEWQTVRKQYPSPERTVSEAVDHIDHIVNIAGIDHIGIGTDFDGGGGLKDCADVSELGNITLELVKRGYSETDIEKIWGGNFMRVFKEVENSASK